MALIESPRHRPEDLAHWRSHARLDEINAAKPALQRKIDRAKLVLERFVGEGAYCGVSWGKDSMVVAHLLAQMGADVPLVFVRIEPIKNPDSASVRDAYLARFPARYEEIEVWCRHDDHGWHATGTLEAGFARAVERYGRRHISGVRGEESRQRSLRVRKWGESSPNTCAPIGWWTTDDVFAYLSLHDLPVHPAYAYSRGGLWRRDRLRVDCLGCQFGRGHGRAEWERLYYGEEIRMIESGVGGERG